MNNAIEIIVFVVSTIAAFLYMRAIRSTVLKGQVSDEQLTRAERPYVLVLVVLSPLVAGALFYYGWIKRLPHKAKKANNYSIIVFVILGLMYIALGGL